MVKVFHNPKCSKSRAVLEIIAAAGEKAEVRDYLEHPLSFEELEALHLLLEIPAYHMVRMSEALYQERYSHLDTKNDKALLQAIAESPILLERPIVIRDGKAVIGRPPESIKSLFPLGSDQ